MLNAATLANRYTILPGQRVVTLTPQNPRTAAVTGINGVVRRPWSKNEVQAFGAGIETDTAAFLIPKATLLAAAAALNLASITVPKPGWWITDDESNTWLIKSVSRELEGAMFRCPCILNITPGAKQ